MQHQYKFERLVQITLSSTVQDFWDVSQQLQILYKLLESC